MKTATAYQRTLARWDSYENFNKILEGEQGNRMSFMSNNLWVAFNWVGVRQGVSGDVGIQAVTVCTRGQQLCCGQSTF